MQGLPTIFGRSLLQASSRQTLAFPGHVADLPRAVIADAHEGVEGAL